MSTGHDRIEWEDVSDAAARMFRVWCDDGEIKWVEECWQHFQKDEMTGSATVLEETATYLRLVTLARVYEEFCGCAWDENPGHSFSDFAEDLKIDRVALGILAANTDEEDFDVLDDEDDLFEAALKAVSDSLRAEVFGCLAGAYGGDIQLYSRMSKTNRPTDDDEEENDDFREFEVTGPNSVALSYVMNGFQLG